MASLQPHHADFVSRSGAWPYYYDMPYREDYIRYLIQHYESVGIFTDENPDTPVSLTIQYPYGQTGFAFTVEEYRSKGLSTVAKNEIIRRVVSAGSVSTMIERNEQAPPPKPELGLVKSGFKTMKFLLK